MRPQVCELFGGEAKSEILRETPLISPDLLIELLCRHTKQRRKIRGEHHLMSADLVNVWSIPHTIYTNERGELFPQRTLTSGSADRGQ